MKKDLLELASVAITGERIMITLDKLNAEAATKALDDIGELIDQLASNAREFDFSAANRMERAAAKALLIIEGAINALPRLIESARRVERLEAALEKIANGDGIYGMQAGEYKQIARAALKVKLTCN